MRLGILGGGSWGTALAIMWARKGHEVRLWVRNSRLAKTYQNENCNTRYLPAHPFPANLEISDDLADTCRRGDLICLAVPLQTYRGLLDRLRALLEPERHRLLLLSKGIELETDLLPTPIVLDVLGESWRDRVFVLSGPSFAREVARDKPTTVVLAGHHGPTLERLQSALNCPNFRMYRNGDVVGVELAGALKNVIAIASGLASGLDLGHNAIAGLITRGLAEMARLGVAMGANRETFAGLAGMGDLILTCKGELSRNLRVGLALAKGLTLREILDDLGMVAEGVQTCRAAFHLGQRLGVELPITRAVYRILHEGLSPQKALRELMSRGLKAELDTADGSPV